MKLFFALGTRPEAIKLAPLILCCRKTAGLHVTVCNTGQHKTLARDMLAAFSIKADIDLDIMTPGQSLTDITTNLLRAIEKPLKDMKPDWMIVQGDTTTSFAAALAAFYQKIRIAHVEAGLRTGDRYSPWPEEMNRRLNSSLATHHFAPTELSRKNLIAEGFPDNVITVTGNTGIDALFLVRQMLRDDPEMRRRLVQEMVGKGLSFLTHNEEPDNLVVVTAHRRENFGSGMASICKALVQLSARFPDLKFVFPVHPNPQVTEPVERIIKAARRSNIFLTKPLDYLPFTYLMTTARLIVSDSGGIQEEAVALGKRLVILRESTERAELVGLPGVQVVGTECEKIVGAVQAALSDPTPCEPLDLFGDGFASQRITAQLKYTT